MVLSAHDPAPTNSLTFPSDPILSAIAAHRQGWSAFANASPESKAGAAMMQRGALANLLLTPCTTHAGAETLLRHLRACLAANGSTLRLSAEVVRLLEARACDLALFLDLPGARAPLPVGPAASAVVRVLNRAGEAVAALVLITGGIFLTGLASLF